MTTLIRNSVLCALLAAFCLPMEAQDSKPGTVTGIVLDAVTGERVRQVRVEVEGRPELFTTTDLDGQYTLKLPPGTYKLRFLADNYYENMLTDIVVTSGGTLETSTVLSNKSTMTTTVDVVEKVGSVATAEAMLTERKLAPGVSDSMSREEIRKTVASDAAGAVEKVTGVSIVDSGYVYVRGLGERYSATMLNNALLPTTEPERRVVPLDMFPAALIENITVLKTYSPDLPGEFSGGLVQMRTVEFPSSRIFNVGMSFGYNSRTTGDRFQSYRGGNRDFFGFDDGTRDLPSIIPQDRLFPGAFTNERFQELGRAFPVNWEPEFKDSARPVQTYTVTGGDTFGRLGVVGAFTFSNKPQRYQESQRYLVNAGGGQAKIFTDYPDFERGFEAARMGAVLNAALRLTPSNKLVFRGTYTHDSEKEARRFVGLNGGIDTVIQADRLRWIERGLFSTSVEGEHSIARLGNSLFHWQMTYSESNRDEPDLRETIRGQREDGSFAFLALPQSALRFSNSLDDRIYEPLLEWGKPFYNSRISALLKLGVRGTFRRRDFEARRFRFVPTNASSLNFLLPTNELLGPENITPSRFVIRENTRGTDTYSAEMDVYGAFAMVDLALGPKWRVVGGVRVEDAKIEVVTIDPLVPGGIPAIAQLDNRDPLPSLSLTYALTSKHNIRVGYGRTLSRPDFRELSPFDFTNVLGGFNTVGNPNLRRAKIDNYDLRWEWFPGGNQVIAASYFYKDFTDPIEVTIQPTTDLRQSFLNAAGAQNQGIELEFRRDLRFIHSAFTPFSLHTNFTFVDSDVDIPADQALLLTSKKRPLLGQSRYIFNLGAEWNKPEWRSSARFYVNSVSRRITDVGTFGLPDIYQERNTFLDFVYQYTIGERWSLRVTLENLGDNHYLWTQADITQRSFRVGRTFSVGTSFSLF
ncbi:MAG: TonB-dependent receptor [Acidobacteriota bacterium]